MAFLRFLAGGLAAATLSIAFLPAGVHATTEGDNPDARDAACAGRDPAAKGKAEADCQPRTMDDAIAATKLQAALNYKAMLDGKEQPSKVESLDRWLGALTGEGKRENPTLIAAQSRASGAFGFSGPATVKTSIQKYFWPFEQINSYYCGPATAQSILRFLGPAESQTVNADTGKRDRLDGDPNKDQPMLASDFWLKTDAYNGTNWGKQYMQFTINAWRGTRWYVQSATPMAGGTLTKDQALAAIIYDTDRSYPVAENVLYSSNTYYPAGFMPGISYQHWDTVYGHYLQGSKHVVQVGQVYHDTRLPYERFHDVDWDLHWSAIGNWFGIVW